MNMYVCDYVYDVSICNKKVNEDFIYWIGNSKAIYDENVVASNIFFCVCMNAIFFTIVYLVYIIYVYTFSSEGKSVGSNTQHSTGRMLSFFDGFGGKDDDPDDKNRKKSKKKKESWTTKDYLELCSIILKVGLMSYGVYYVVYYVFLHPELTNITDVVGSSSNDINDKYKGLQKVYLAPLDARMLFHDLIEKSKFLLELDIKVSANPTVEDIKVLSRKFRSFETQYKNTYASLSNGYRGKIYVGEAADKLFQDMEDMTWILDTVTSTLKRYEGVKPTISVQDAYRLWSLDDFDRDFRRVFQDLSDFENNSNDITYKKLLSDLVPFEKRVQHLAGSMSKYHVPKQIRDYIIQSLNVLDHIELIVEKYNSKDDQDT